MRSWITRPDDTQAAKISGGRKSCVIEMLEPRQLLSAAPLITSVDPSPLDIIATTGHISFAINGTNFNLGSNILTSAGSAKVLLTAPNGQSVDEVATGEVAFTEDTSTMISLSTPDFTINSFPPGKWTAEVVNPDGQASNHFAFEVTLGNVAPVITGVDPAPVVTSGQGGHLMLTLQGSNFQVNFNAFNNGQGEIGAGSAAVVLTSPSGQSFNEVAEEEVDLAGSTDTQLDISTPDFTGQAAGQWFAQVTNPTGMSSAEFAFTVARPAAPTITTQPQSQAVTAGSGVTFTTAVSGTQPFTYQWQLAGQPLAGQTNSTLVLSNVQASQAGAYTVVVTNYIGSATSQSASLIVSPTTAPTIAPVITTQPQPQSVSAGANVTFAVSATGTAPLQYQWQFNGANIAGQTSSTLTLNNVSTVQAGAYMVVVSNSAGVVQSSTAALAVSAPVVSSSPLSFSLASPAFGKTGKKANAVLTVVNSSSQTVKQVISITLLLSSDTTLSGEVAALLSTGKTVNLRAGRSKNFSLSFKVPVIAAANYNLLAQLNNQSLIVAPSQIAVVLSPTKK